MSKLDLQKELLEKVKLGTKPSDLKKQQQKNSQIPTPPDSPLIEPIKKTKPESPLVQGESKKIKQLQAQVNYWNQTSQTYLINLQRTTAELDQAQEEIKGLKKQKPETISQAAEQALIEANQKIREQEQIIKEEQEKNAKLTKMQDLQKQSKTTEEIKPEKTKTFTCSVCQKEQNLDFLRLAQSSGKKTCRPCTLLMLKRANQLTGLKIVLKKKSSETTPTKTFTCQTCQQTHEGEPHQVHISNFQEQGISPRQLANICSSCLESKVNLANFYCPRTSEGRDTYNPHEPQFDCDCPIGGQHG